MKIIVNGEDQNVNENSTITELIDTLGIKVSVMAAAVNMEIVKKENWNLYRLSEGDKLDLLDFVGGG